MFCEHTGFPAKSRIKNKPPKIGPYWDNEIRLQIEWLSHDQSLHGSSADCRPPGRTATVMAAIKNRGLHTVCEEAHCPNRLECFASGTVNFLLLGPSCTRRCTFCAVDKSSVHKPGPGEPARTASLESGSCARASFCYQVWVDFRLG